MHRIALALFSAALIHAADPALTIEGVTGRDGVAAPAIQFTLAEFAALPHTKVTVKSEVYEGVPVYDLLKKAGQPFGEQLRKGQLVRYAIFSAHDGYRVLFALPEFDPAFTAARAIVADRVDGKPLDAKKGPLKLVLPDEKTGARSIYMLERIELQSAPEPVR
jgi:DMSO/TMAO reductase YedYZ molybdopterin-dependent catalytic subunit